MTKIIKIPNEEEKSKDKLTPKVENAFEKIKISKPTLDILSKIGVYSINYFPELFSKLYQVQNSIGNAYGAIGFATLDVLSKKNKKFKRLTKFGGYLWYVGEGIYDLTSALTDQENAGVHLGNFALDVSMAYQLGKDMGSLYRELDTQSKDDKKSGISKDLEEIVSFIKEKFKSKKEIKTSEETTSEKSGSLKKYLLNFGEKSLLTMELGAGIGYGFGKGAFEKLKENYSEYSKKRAEKSKIKKEIKIKEKEKRTAVEDEEREKTHFSSDKSTPLKKKKQILKCLEDCEKNPKFMKNYEIENEYVKFKQKPIDEQIKIVQNRDNSLRKSLNQIGNAPLLKRIFNVEETFDMNLELKRIENILWELDIEKKNRPIQKYL